MSVIQSKSHNTTYHTPTTRRTTHVPTQPDHSLLSPTPPSLIVLTVAIPVTGSVENNPWHACTPRTAWRQQTKTAITAVIAQQ
jgi:hypothetical protein